jgi:hypothetical protein
MKHIKLYEEFSKANETVLRNDLPKIKSFIDKLLTMVKDSELVKDIKNFVSNHEIDPYPYTFETFIKDLKAQFSNKVDFSNISESINESKQKKITSDIEGRLLYNNDSNHIDFDMFKPSKEGEYKVYMVSKNGRNIRHDKAHWNGSEFETSKTLD